MDVLELIKTRRSIREFLGNPVEKEKLEKILEAGRWAPSGLNNQPWKFKVVTENETKNKLAECTKYGHIIKNAPVSIVVFLNNNEGYDRTKDVQAIGACIQNMLLEIHALGLGGVWLGEILNQREKAEKILGVPKNLELMAVIALGYPKSKSANSNRKSTKELSL